MNATVVHPSYTLVRQGLAKTTLAIQACSQKEEVV